MLDPPRWRARPAAPRSALQRPAAPRSSPQRPAAPCSALQRPAAPCSAQAQQVGQEKPEDLREAARFVSGFADWTRIKAHMSL